jgi:PKD repeat protein
MKSLFVAVLLLSPLFLIAQDTIQIKPGPEGKDALIWSILPDNNYGDSPKFLSMSWTFGGIPGADRSLIQFDLAEIPEGREIISAKLNLFFKNLEPNEMFHAGENTSVLRLITEPWSEQTVTWNNAPATTDDFQVILPQSVNPRQDYLNIDVTEAVRKLYQFPDMYFGWILSLLNETPYSCLLFASGDIDEGHLRPMLEVVYSEQSALTALFSFEVHENALVSFFNQSEGYSVFNWSFGDGNSSAEEHPVHQYQNAGHYNVCLNATNDTMETTYCDSVFLCNSSISLFTVEVFDLGCRFVNQSENADVYIWDFGDGFQSQLSSPEHIFSADGLYTVRLIASNECSSDTSTMMVAINAADANSLIGIFPNPTTGRFSFSSTVSEPFRLEIVDHKGSVVIKDEGVTIANESRDYFLSGYSGIYCCRVWMKNKWYQRKIFLLNQ